MEITTRPAGTETALTQAEAIFTPAELAQYRRALDRKEPELSPETSARMFAQFLRGVDCSEIARLNRGIGLGAICRQRLIDDWDRRRADYRRDLLAATADRVQQITLEAIEFTANQLAAAHKLHGDKAKRFLGNGDEAELGSFAITSMKGYRDTLDTLRELVVGKPPEQKPPAAPAPPPSEEEVVEASAVNAGPAASVPASQAIRAALVARGQRR